MQPVKPLAARTRPVVVGFDGSSDGEAVLRWAVQDSVNRGLGLRVVRAWQSDDDLAQTLRQLTPVEMDACARARTAETLRDMNSGLPTPDSLEVVVSGGEPGRAIVSATHDAVVAVVGRHRLDLRKRLFVGNVGDFVLEHAGCPVVLVPMDRLPDVRTDHRTVVVGIDGSLEGREALAFAADEAARRDASLTIVVAWFRPAPVDEFKDELLTVHQELEEQQRLLHDAAEHVRRMPGGSDLALELRVGTDAPGPCLVTESAGGLLLVVGSHGRGWLGRLALGSVSRYCVQHGTVPVAVVPRP